MGDRVAQPCADGLTAGVARPPCPPRGGRLCVGRLPLYNRRGPTSNHGLLPMDEHSSADPLKPKYRRVVLKLSGEGFGTPGKSGISIDETLNVARQAQRIVQRGVQLAIVIGGGNILRGTQFSAGGEVIREATAHYMGMLATILNGLALQDA